MPPPGEEVPEGGGQPYPAYGADPTGASFGPYARRESWLSELLDID